MANIKKAIIAVAGSGTRLLPATKNMPKEMLPIVDKPIIQLVVEELVSAGIEDIIMVTKWDKKPLEDHFDYNWALASELEKAGKHELKEKIKQIADMANFIYVRQIPQYGNGAPILSAASLVKDEPFVFCYGDDLVMSKTPFAGQMAKEYQRIKKPVMGVQAVDWSQVNRYGTVVLEKGTGRVTEIVEKPDLENARSNLASFGRMILNQEIVDELKRTPLGKGNELWVADAIGGYIRNGGEIYAKQIEDGEWLTTGDPFNYLKATLSYALERDDIKKELTEYLKKIIK